MSNIKHKHANAEVVIQKVYQHLAGDHTDDQPVDRVSEWVKNGLIFREISTQERKKLTL